MEGKEWIILIRILEKIVGVNGNEELKRILGEGYTFVARTQKKCDFYRRGHTYIIYDPKVDRVLKTFETANGRNGNGHY